MASKLEELRRKKELLRKELSEKEQLLTFQNPKESLSAITNGYTDDFLKETVDENGESKVSLKTGNVLSLVTNGASERFLKEIPTADGGTKLGIRTAPAVSGFAENALRLGVAAIAGNFAKRKLKSPSWKQKIIGALLVYLAPFLIRILRQKLEEFRKKETMKNMEKLI